MNIVVRASDLFELPIPPKGRWLHMATFDVAYNLGKIETYIAFVDTITQKRYIQLYNNQMLEPILPPDDLFYELDHRISLMGFDREIYLSPETKQRMGIR